MEVASSNKDIETSDASFVSESKCWSPVIETHFTACKSLYTFMMHYVQIWIFYS